MALNSEQVTVSTVAIALTAAETDTISGASVIVRNTDATNGVALGNGAVAAGTGYRLLAGASVTVALRAGEQLYAIRTGAADVVVDVLRTGV